MRHTMHFAATAIVSMLATIAATNVQTKGISLLILTAVSAAALTSVLSHRAEMLVFRKFFFTLYSVTAIIGFAALSWAPSTNPPFVARLAIAAEGMAPLLIPGFVRAGCSCFRRLFTSTTPGLPEAVSLLTSLVPAEVRDLTESVRFPLQRLSFMAVLHPGFIIDTVLGLIIRMLRTQHGLAAASITRDYVSHRLLPGISLSRAERATYSLTLGILLWCIIF